jgi:hypothetical protein
MSLDAARAVVAEARRQGKPAFAHPSNQEGLDVAIESEVDVLAHTTPDDGQPWTPEFVDRLTSRDMALIPTAKIFTPSAPLSNCRRARPAASSGVPTSMEGKPATRSRR